MHKTLTRLTIMLGLMFLGQTGTVIGAENCMAMATDLASRGGGRAMEVAKKMSMDSELTAEDLKVSDEAFASAEKYVSSGCAMNHLQTAMDAADTASEVSGALKGLGF